MSFQIPSPDGGRVATQADIVFAVDSTGSMQPCIDGVRSGILSLVNGLQSAAAVDYRLRLIAYRDIHPGGCNTPWHTHPFTHSADEFKTQLAAVSAEGGGDPPESTLDALYLALHSDWRPGTQKTIVLMTDDDTHATLHPKTYPGHDNDVLRIVKDFSALDHIMLFLVAPQFPIYEQLEQSIRSPTRKVIANWVSYDSAHVGLARISWMPLMRMIGEVVSATSIVVTQQRRPSHAANQ